MKRLDPKQWYPTGRGSSYSFGVSRGELFQAIDDAISPNKDRYSFVYTIGDIPMSKRTFCGRHEFVEVSFDRFLQELEYGISALWLRNLDLTPELTTNQNPADAVFSVNGFIRVTDGQSMSMIACESSVGLRPRFYNSETDEEIYHEGYERVFRSIKRNLNKLKRKQVVSSQTTPPRHHFYASKNFEAIFANCPKRDRYTLVDTP